MAYNPTATALTALADALTLLETATPATTPASGSDLLYFKSDHNLYSKDSTGAEHLIGGEGVFTNQNLSNLLAPTAINQSLLFGTDNTLDIGALNASRPANVYVGSGLYALTINIEHSDDSFYSQISAISDTNHTGSGSILFTAAAASQGGHGIIFQLNDDTTNTHVTLNGATNLRWFTDAGASIGESGAHRPANVYMAGFLEMAGITTPANPPATNFDLYFKADGNLYSLNSAGTEVQINTVPSNPGGASGSVQFNNAGVFGGFGTWNGTTLSVNALLTPLISGSSAVRGSLVLDSTSNASKLAVFVNAPNDSGSFSTFAMGDLAPRMMANSTMLPGADDNDSFLLIARSTDTGAGPDYSHLFYEFGNGGGPFPLYIYGAARGTPESPAFLQTNDHIAALWFSTYGQGDYTNGQPAAGIDVIMEENATDSAHGARFGFFTSPKGAAPARRERFRIDSLGNILLMSTSSANLAWNTDLSGDIGSENGGTTLNRPNNIYSGGFHQLQQIATPSNPAALNNRLYFKSDDNLYILNSAGLEVQISNSSITALTGDVSAAGPGSAAATVVSADGGTGSFAAGYISLPTTTSTTQGVLQQNSSVIFSTYGLRNLFLGSSSGNFTFNTGTASDHVGIGQNTLHAITAGEGGSGGCVAIGSAAVSAATTPHLLVGIGVNTLAANITGSQAGHVAVGANNLRFWVTDAGSPYGGGDTNITMGINTGAFTTGDGNILIGNSNIGGGSSISMNAWADTYVGHYSGSFDRGTSQDNAGFGYGALSGSHTVTNPARNAGFGSNSFFNIAGSGIVDNAGLGYGTGQTYALYAQCVLIGSGADTTANNQTNAIAIGYGTTAASNTIQLGNASITDLYTQGNIRTVAGSYYLPETTATVGQIFQYSSDQTGFQVVFHTYSDQSLSPINGNIFIGDGVNGFGPPGNFTMGGGDYQGSIGIGSGTLSNLTTGDRNIAIGSGTNHGALSVLTTGSFFLAIGNDAGGSWVTGSQNTLLGAFSGVAITSGSNNLLAGGGDTSDVTVNNSVWLGVNITESTVGVTNSIIVGEGVTGHGSNAITLGNTSITGVFTSGAWNTSLSQTTYTGSVSGTAVWSMPFQGSSYKKFVINLQALNDAGGTITFPTAFTNTPYLYGDTAATAVSSASTTTFTLSVTAGVTGNVFVEGF